jgi:hypothetical protein
MNRRLKDFLVLTLLTNTLDGIVCITAFIRRLLLKIFWLIAGGVFIQGGLHYMRGSTLSVAMDDSRFMAGVVALFFVVVYCIVQPYLYHAFIWIIKKLYPSEIRAPSIH